jgi:hypothetical protein
MKLTLHCTEYLGMVLRLHLQQQCMCSCCVCFHHILAYSHCHQTSCHLMCRFAERMRKQNAFT